MFYLTHPGHFEDDDYSQSFDWCKTIGFTKQSLGWY